MYIYFFIALLFTPDLNPVSLTLPQAKTTGLQEKKSLHASAQTIAVQQHNQSREYSKLFPQITVAHTSLLSKELSLDATQHTISLQGSQIIFNAAGPLLQGRIAELSTQQAQQHHTAERNAVRHALSMQFLQTWLLQEKNILIRALKQYSTILGCAIEREYMHGYSNVVEYHEIQTTRAEYAQTIYSYRSELITAHSNLAYLMGKDSYNQKQTPFLSYNLHKPLPLLQPLKHYTALALQTRPELQEKNLSSEQYTLIAQSHERGYLPTVSTYASLSKTFAGAQAEQGNNSSLGITIQWNIFDGLQRVHAAHAAHANKLKTLFEKHDLKNMITHQITEQYHKIKMAHRALSVTRAQCKEHTIRTRQVQSAYQKHMTSARAYAKQIVSYFQALSRLRAQLIALHSNWHTLAYYCGYPATGEFDEL
jgi:outer membrane protein TolC